MSEKAPPKVITTPASQYAGNEGSGEAHFVAGNEKSSTSSWAIPGVALFQPSDQSSGDTHPAAAFATPKSYPVANVATPKAIADGIESGQGESKPLSEKAPPKVLSTPMSHDVDNESSGDAHPVACVTSIEPKFKECVEEIIQIPQTDNSTLSQGDSLHSGIKESSSSTCATPGVLSFPPSGQSSGDTHPVAALATSNTYPIANLATSETNAGGIKTIQKTASICLKKMRRKSSRRRRHNM